MASGASSRGPLEIKTVVIGRSETELPVDRLHEQFPGVTFVNATGDDITPYLGSMDAYIGYSLDAEHIRDAPRLKWIQILSAGVEQIVNPLLVERGIIVTNASGVHGVNIAEHVLAMMLAFARSFPTLLRDQASHQWRGFGPHLKVFELQGQTVLVVGLGSIGTAIAERARALGMRVIGVRRHAGGTPPDGIERVVPIDDIDSALPEADHVVISLPLTSATRGLFDRERLSKFKDGAYFYNIGRGAIVDQDALIELLRFGKIAGAGLDVVTPEPLPADSPLWDMPNVILTAHTSGRTPRWLERALPIVEENLRRLLIGEPVINEVDVRSGY